MLRQGHKYWTLQYRMTVRSEMWAFFLLEKVDSSELEELDNKIFLFSYLQI